jgi:hypothetical protein
MTTKHALRKMVRSLHRNIFHSVPNTGPREIDLSKLKPPGACDVQEYAIESDVHFNRRAMQTLETWE